MTFSQTTSITSNKVFFFRLDSKPISKLYKNGVHVLNRELKSTIDLSKFELEGRYVENKDVSSASYIQVWLRSLAEQTYVLGTKYISLSYYSTDNQRKVYKIVNFMISGAGFLC